MKYAESCKKFRLLLDHRSQPIGVGLLDYWVIRSGAGKHQGRWILGVSRGDAARPPTYGRSWRQLIRSSLKDMLRHSSHLKSSQVCFQHLSTLAAFNIFRLQAVAEVSKIGHYRRGELLWWVDGRANPLMDRKVFGVVFFRNGRNGCSDHLTHNRWM